MPQLDSRSILTTEIFAPKIQVRFHTDEGGLEFQSNEVGGQEESLVSCQTVKDLGQPTGSFIIHLTDQRRYDKLLKPMDFVTIKMSNHSPTNPLTGNVQAGRDRIVNATMIGFVDSVRRKRLIDPTSGRPSVFLEVRGRDFGKLFVKHMVRYIAWLAGDPASQVLADPIIAMFKSLLSGFTTGGYIDFLVLNILTTFFTKSVSMTIPFDGSKVPIINAISYRAMGQMGLIPFNLPLMAQEGKLWNVMQNFANLPFNEMWVDTVSDPLAVINPLAASAYSTPLTQDKVDKAKNRTQNLNAQLSPADKAVNVSNLQAQPGFKFNGPKDQANAYAMFFLRRTPFDQDDWDALTRIKFSNADVAEQDLGTTDDETYNFFWVYPLLGTPNEIALKGIGIRPMLFTKETQFDEKLGANGMARGIPISLKGGAPASGLPTEEEKHKGIARLNAMEKYGFAPLEVSTRLWQWAADSGLSGADKTAAALSLTLANWNKHNAGLKQGSMTIKGIPEAKVGQVLQNVDEKEEYYIEALAHNWIRYQSITTTAMVTRGQPVKGSNPIDWGNAYTDYCKSPPLKLSAMQL